MNKEQQGALSTGLVLIGIGLIFLLPGLSFWPWILVVMALGSLPSVLAHGGDWWAWQSTFWLFGLAVLFATGHFWPGILVLSGASMLLGGLTHQRATTNTAGDSAAAPAHSAAAPERSDASGWGAPDDDSLDVGAPLFEGEAEEPWLDDEPEQQAAVGRDTHRL